ncbi:MAG: helix-hairpin-helix domain-containing protein [Candidatus Omnitrophota bacterium]|nr:helix-hairpin-helix domain-containing protein [Candidatus Omnitrophota bacterium]
MSNFQKKKIGVALGSMKKDKTLTTSQDLQSLMNIGPAIAKRLHAIGITTSSQLKKSNPEKVYEKLRKKEGKPLDRCVLYVLRGAIKNTPWWICKDTRKSKT